ncbi:unnamed protein product [Protopolystoma xenopodis]|uniref:Uncharacterized protein n=1 Tax=Protopolystoma xenopodis TaxID=117903 RepID=A0A3S5AZ40_9PLAT|nr:unnamed protein product [Protopolystoma xenopodis]
MISYADSFELGLSVSGRANELISHDRSSGCLPFPIRLVNCGYHRNKRSTTQSASGQSKPVRTVNSSTLTSTAMTRNHISSTSTPLSNHSSGPPTCEGLHQYSSGCYDSATPRVGDANRELATSGPASLSSATHGLGSRFQAVVNAGLEAGAFSSTSEGSYRNIHLYTLILLSPVLPT